VWPYPLISTIYLCLERQAITYLRPVLVQILRPHFGRGPLAVITTLPCKGDHWIHSGSLGLTTVSTGNALHNTQTSPQRTFAQVEPSKPSGALHLSYIVSPSKSQAIFTIPSITIHITPEQHLSPLLPPTHLNLVLPNSIWHGPSTGTTFYRSESYDLRTKLSLGLNC
jgi:hypothetical protein